MTPQKPFAILTAWSCLAAQAPQAPLFVEKPSRPVALRPYSSPTIPAVRLRNSGRLRSLIRAGKLYLTVQDAIALAIENNLDLEVDRYGPLRAEWQVQRQEAGGPLRGVTQGNTVVNQATSGQGVQGSQIAAGLATNQGTGGRGGGNAIVAQIGPVTPNLDPVLQNISLYSHITTPQENTVQSQTAALVDTHHTYNTFVQQGLVSGGYVQVAANESYLRQNAPTNILNPSVVPVVQIFVQHDFLRGFGNNVNSRFIRVARKNLGVARETFRSQLLNLVATVLNLYWDLVTDLADVKARQHTLDLAQKFYDDSKKEIGIGGTARFELFRAEAELTTRRQELAVSQATLRQQENLLKNALSRNGLEDPWVDAAEVVPLDSIQVPEQDELPPFRQLVATAVAKRPDVALARMNLETAQISALGTANGILPVLRGTAATFNSGLSGVSNPQPGGLAADPYYVGGLGNALAQVFRRNFPNNQARLVANANPGNRIHQGDYGIDQLQLRQSELITQRSMNQLVVDISNQIVALRQARARYSLARDTRTLQEQLLEKEQRRFSLGGSTRADVIVVQRGLAAAQTAEVAALSAYSHARVSLEQVLGETLERNHVSVEGALQGTAGAPVSPPQ